MKKLSFLVAILPMLFCACSSFYEDDSTPIFSASHNLRAGFAEDTRTYVENSKHLRWHEDDRLTAFFGNTLNRQYKFNGKTGDNSGTFSLVSGGELGTGNTLNTIYAVYPYNETTTITDDGVISLTLPTTQSYAENSFGKGANTMIAVTKNLGDTFLGFKNACGYLKLKFYDANGATVKSIEVKGNNNEKIAGAATATIAFGESPVLTMADDATTTVTIDCGEGVALGTTADTATEFWVVVPETTFTNGISVKVFNSEGGVFCKSTHNKIVIARNEIQPMAALKADNFVPIKEIYYTSTDGEVITPNNMDDYIVSNTYEDGKGVIKYVGAEIPQSAFKECTTLTSITLPEGVTAIGEYAFYKCSELARINIPNSMTTIGEYAFRNCSLLKRVDITDLLAYLKISFNLYSGNPCRNGAKLYINDVEATEITIPSDITEITKCTFAGCASITSVTFHEGITSIGDYAFEDCSALENVTFDNCIVSVGSTVFNKCTSLKRVDITNLSAFCKMSIKSTSAAPCFNGAQLYLNGEEVTELTIPADITRLNSANFYGCTSLASVTLHENVVSVNSFAFSKCENLTNVYCKATTPPTARRGASNGAWSVFNNNASGRLIYVPLESVDAYKAADGWSDYADSIVGYDYNQIHEIDYTSTDGEVITPKNMDDYIVSNTYENGKGVIKYSGAFIPQSAFQECATLTSITIPEGITAIGASAFNNCSALANISIPKTLIAMGESAFTGCTALTRVDITDLSAWYKITFALQSNPLRNGGKLYLNGEEVTELVIPADITEVKDRAFSGCTSITSVTLHDGITSIGDGAFWYCSALANVTFDNCVTRIKTSAFYGCTSLKRVDITNLSAWCKTSIKYTNTAPCYYGAQLYLNGEEVTELTIPADITRLTFANFYGCTSLTSVSLHENVEFINSCAFTYCTNLTNVYCKATTPPAIKNSTQGHWSAFNKNASGRKIYVPTESVDAYKAANGWSDYADSIVGYDF